MAAQTTFHVVFGEMTITLDDIWTILGIQVMGKLVSTESAESLVTIALGVTPRHIKRCQLCRVN